MRDYRNYVSAVCMAHRSPEPSDGGSVELDELRAKAERYRSLAETLVNPRVIAVVLACARELEMEAMLIETADAAFCSVIPPDQAPIF